MPKTVLIARPHTFIVSVMTPFLEESGYVTRKLAHIGDLPVQSGGIVGAVISLALSSSIDESATEVFLRFKSVAPHVPVLFAAMLTLEQARPALERLAKAAEIEAHILGANATSASLALLGRPETFLYVNKEDLIAPESSAIVARLVQRHFH